MKSFSLVQPRQILCYSEKLLAHKIGPEYGDELIVTFRELKNKFVVSKKFANGDLYVQLTNCSNVELDV